MRATKSSAKKGTKVERISLTFVNSYTLQAAYNPVKKRGGTLSICTKQCGHQWLNMTEVGNLHGSQGSTAWEKQVEGQAAFYSALRWLQRWLRL